MNIRYFLYILNLTNKNKIFVRFLFNSILKDLERVLMLLLLRGIHQEH